MIIPPFLKQGDKVAIVSPASAVKTEYIDGACRVLKEWGYEPVVGKYAKNRSGYYSGSLEERLSDFRSVLHDSSIKAILCSRGGYGTIHLAEHLSQNELRDNAKWIIGFSDISVLHAMLNNAGIASVHASMAKHLSMFGAEDSCNSALHDILEGKYLAYEIASHEYNRIGDASGELVGGNIAVLSGLIGTQLDIFKKDKILFIEDIGEPIYKVERMLYNLRLSGILPYLKGLIVGQFSNCTEPDSNRESMYSMINRMVKPYNYPVAFNFPIGHVNNNRPLIVGGYATLSITNRNVLLSE